MRKVALTPLRDVHALQGQASAIVAEILVMQ
jgi:hypothetical protein